VSSKTQPYHHGNLRPVLVDTAVELARSTGPDGVVLREVARRAGVSHNAAYRHFSDRAALLAEVSDRAYADLERAMLDRIATVTEVDPQERAFARLRETGRAYVDYAIREPGLFTTAFTASESTDAPTDALTDAPSDPVTDTEEPTGPYLVLNQVLDELVACGAVSPERRVGADLACWSAVHGFSDLVVHGPLRELPAELRDAGLEIVLDVIRRGLAD
jgi:AcrR family transcriptional regulator